MSLINDALQRAKQQTAQPAQVSNLQLRPLEPAPEERKNSGVLFSILLVALLVCATVLISGWRKRSRPVPAAPAANAVPSLSIPAPQLAAVTGPSVPATDPAVPAVPAAPPAVADAEPPSDGTPAMLVPTPALKPAPPRLQAIFFNQTNPSAIISGRTVSAGGRVEAFQVAAITATSVTLVSGTETNILRFQE